MAGFKKFEEIKAWQRAREATKRVYEITSDGNFAKDFGLRDQLRRAAVSVMANIAEGQGRNSDKEFANFLNIAHGSIAETQSHLYIAVDLGYLNENDFRQIYDLFEEVGKMTMSLMRHLRKS
ncbi:MAG: four helix bundle protein [Acidobacteria bacterium]|nr:four helix bundle protein [Acidobacteriota bacterium]